MGEYSAYISNAAGSAYSSAQLIVLSMYANAHATKSRSYCILNYFELKILIQMFTDTVTVVFCNRARGDYASR